MALRRYQEAEMALRRAYALTPNFPGVHQELMASLSYQGKYEEAVEIGRRSVAQWPEDEGVVVNLAIALFRSGSKKEAISLLDDLLVVKPDSKGALEFRRRMIEAMQKPRGLLARLFGRRR
jgi:tetratricopeptide (TPR) repeat protein